MTIKKKTTRKQQDQVRRSISEDAEITENLKIAGETPEVQEPFELKIITCQTRSQFLQIRAVFD